MTHPGLWAQEKEWTQEAAPGIEIQPSTPPHPTPCKLKTALESYLIFILLWSFLEIFLNSVRIPSVKYRLSPNCPDASWKARSIRSPLGEGWRGSGWRQPTPRDWQDASQVFLTSSVSGTSWNTVTLESISHYPPVNSLFDRYILKPLNLYAQSGPHPHVAESRPIPSSRLALTTQWKANQLGCVVPPILYWEAITFLSSIFRSVSWLLSQPSVLKEPEAGMGTI